MAATVADGEKFLGKKVEVEKKKVEEPAEAAAPKPFARTGTMALTAAEGEKFLGKTAEAEKKEALERSTTMAATVAEGEKILAKAEKKEKKKEKGKKGKASLSRVYHGLEETNVVLEKRKPKGVERFAPTAAAPATVKGEGKPLGSIGVEDVLGKKAKGEEDEAALSRLHTVMYGRAGEKASRRKEILAFCGWDWVSSPHAEEERAKKVEAVERISKDHVRRIHKLLGIALPEEKVGEKLIEFLEKPSKAKYTEIKKKKKDEKKKREKGEEEKKEDEKEEPEKKKKKEDK